MHKAVLSLLALSLLLTACRRGNGEAPLDTPTMGEITIAVDESFRPLAEAEIAVFESDYKYATINPVWLPENEAIRELVEGNVRLAVVSRGLTEAEKNILRQQKLIPREPLKVAVDGVGLIVNKANADSMLTMDQLQSIFSGETKAWADLGNGGLNQNITIVFDNNNSSNLNFILDKFSIDDLNHLNVFATESNAEVISYVENNANALGVIGTNWISDSEDPSQQRFKSSISVVALSNTPNPSSSDYYQPYQAYLALEQYPLRRDVLIITREARAGLGSGFMSHVASDRGQRIILKSGLLPATMPVRLVGIRDNF